MIKIIFFADGGANVGLGHAIRCAALALGLRHLGAEVRFVGPREAGLDDLLAGYGLKREDCAAQADAIAHAAQGLGAHMLVADSYRLDRHLLAQAIKGPKLVWFDDTASQPPLADALINGSPAALSLPYKLPPAVLALLGPAYQVVRPGLTARDRIGPVRRLLVTYGGSDPKQVGPLLATCLPSHLVVDFVVGPFAPIPDNLPANALLHHNPADMAGLIHGADLAITAGGQTLFEMAAAKLPALAIGIGPDQEPNLKAFRQADAIEFAGWAADPHLGANVTEGLARLLNDETRRLVISENAHGLIDGKGAQRLASALLRLLA